jgi:hypothetical protein
MKLIIALLLFGITAQAQLNTDSPNKWHIDHNKWITGSLVFTAGLAKGFNETLMFHWKSFRHSFPNANPQWFNPNESWKNKYKHGDPNAGAKFPLSTSLLAMVTDQYHLNNFINRMAWTSAFVVKIGEGKKPFKQYLLDFVYYSLSYQAGFALTYFPFTKYKGE